MPPVGGAADDLRPRAVSALGTLDVACPNCGEELHVEIQAETVPAPVWVAGEPGLTVKLHPVLPDHSCPPPPAREPISWAA